MIGASPASAAARTAPPARVWPPSVSSSLFWPMRFDDPAASTTAAMVGAALGAVVSFSGMDRFPPLAQVVRRAAGARRQDLGDDAQRHLLRPVGAQIQPDGAKDPLVTGQ